MAFDLHITIPESSPAGQVVQRVAVAENITLEQAVTRILTDVAKQQGKKTPAQEVWGAFSSPEKVDMLDDIVTEAYALRLARQPRNFGLLDARSRSRQRDRSGG